jgi:threonine/homoserine/homoserine lactone efflux protein
MLIDPQVVSFTIVAAALTVVPGADTVLVVRNALRGGRNAGWCSMLGILGGTLTHASASAVGLSVILAKSAAAFQFVKLLGAAYLVWLGIQSFRRGAARLVDAGAGPALPLRVAFREGYLTNILNPKVAVFYLAFLPQFIRPGDPVLAKSLLLACIHNGLGAIWLGTLSVVAGQGRNWLRRPEVGAWTSRVTGGLLVALGVRLAFEKR